MRDRIAGEPVALPAAAERVWHWFWQLDRTRNGNGYAANRIGYPEIRALAGNHPDQWELDAIVAMDAVRLGEVVAEPVKQPEGPPMTLAMFKEWVA